MSEINSVETVETFDLASDEALPGIAKQTEAAQPKPKKAPKPKAEKKDKAKDAIGGKKPPKPKKEKKPVEAPVVITHGNGAAFSEDRPGVIATILNHLYLASEDSPITKAEMFEVLKKKFTDRSESSLHVTVNAQMVACRQWADRRIKLESKPVGRGKGFWLPKGETLEKGRERKRAEAEETAPVKPTKEKKAKQEEVVVTKPAKKKAKKKQEQAA